MSAVRSVYRLGSYSSIMPELAHSRTQGAIVLYHAGDYDWLVVTGSKAIFKSQGAVNGVDGFGFLLSAIDADLNVNDPFEVDRFRIKIWDIATETVHYDNNVGGDDTGDPVTEIRSGQIRIQK